MADPLFLLAPPRSYTSLINAMIGQHPQMFGVPELNLFTTNNLNDLWKKSVVSGHRNHGILRAVAEIYGGEQTCETIIMAKHWAAAREDKNTEDIFRELTAKIDPLILVDKSPMYTISLKNLIRIYKTFPYARFIHLVRHPISQCKSVMNLNYGIFAYFVNAFAFETNRAIIDPQIAWHDININILNFLHAVPDDQQLRILGEKFMENPKDYLAIICDWLSISDSQTAIDEMMHPERSPFACFGPITALFGNDPNFLRNPSFRYKTPKIPSLYDVVPWLDNEKGLCQEVIDLSIELGYSL